jgi:hypothetical protein
MAAFMETREDCLLRLVSVLDDIGADQQVIIRERYIEHAFGGKGAIALQRPKFFALMAARFATTASSNKACSPGYPAGGRA